MRAAKARLSRPLNSWDILKVVAIVLMFVDHSASFLFTSEEDIYWLRAIGRGAAPLFIFLAGLASSYRFSRELLLLALALALFDSLLFWRVTTLNILFSIMIYRMIFNWFERRGKIIRRPVEWYLGSLMLFMTGGLVEYGSMGFMIALAGYMQRHAEHYSPRLRHGLTAVIFITYTAFQIYFSLPPISPVVTIAVMLAVYLVLTRFTLRDVRAPWLPPAGKQALKWVSVTSGYLYAGHLMLLEWLTRLPV
jgi:hypothetical protein